MRRFVTIPALSWLALAGAAPAHAQEIAAGWVVCTHELELIETIVASADERVITTQTELGLRRRIPLEQIYFAIPARRPQRPSSEDMAMAPLENRSPVRVISLSDGQVIRGSLIEPNDPEALSFTLIAGASMHGSATVSLENVLAVGDGAMSDAEGPGEAVDEDTVVTRTGDVLRGFVEGMGPTTFIAAGRDVIEIDTRQIQSVRLANPLEPAPGVYVSTDDDLRLRASAFSFDFQQALTVRVDPVSLGLETDALDTWLFMPDAPAGLRVIDGKSGVRSLTAIEPELVEAVGSGRDWTPAPTVMREPGAHPVLASIDLHAPVRVVYPLPEGTARFACELVAPSNTWTDCVASVTVIDDRGGRRELLRQRLNGQWPSAALNTELGEDAARIEFLIDPGQYGPVQDRVIISRPRFVVRERP